MNMILRILITVSISGYVCRGDELPKCNDCYLKHYVVKGCTPVYESEFDCPVRYICPEKKPDNPSVCVFMGKTYEEGEDIDVGNPCQNCKCRRSFVREGVDVICLSSECGRDLGLPVNDGCYWAYRQDKCCPYQQCTTNEDAQNKVCEYDDKSYKYGEKFYPDNSKTCLCNENWSGVDGSSCTTVGCLMLDLNQKKLQDGCIPIYHEDMCCPIDMLCASQKYRFTNASTIPLAEKEDIESGNTCIFNNTHYKIGQNLNHRDSCLTCSCETPPDFTCVRKKCPPPPNNDYKNCKSDFTPGECCPSYHCIH